MIGPNFKKDPMLAQEIIYKKRQGMALNEKELNFFIAGMLNDSISESQVSAWAMAVYFQGMGAQETAHLTSLLQHSGDTLNWHNFSLNGPVLDKHSTGGVGDKVSMMLAPMMAACGAYVPMISGRGLGHTGGTLDKMDSIPGYQTSPDIETFQKTVSRDGCAIVGQTADLAPADKRLYGIRDITATVESIPLITASILSKKLSAGLDGLILDVKCGNGAFANNHEMANDLAHNIVIVGKSLGLPVSAKITDMSQVLGTTAGNSLEIIEVIEYLTGLHREPRLHQVVMSLCAEMLLLGNLCKTEKEALQKLQQVLDSGLATEYFSKMVASLGGPNDLIENYKNYLTLASLQVPVFAQLDQPMYIEKIDVRALGNIVVELGGGRKVFSDNVNHAVGLSQIKRIGDEVSQNEPLLMLYAQNENDVDKLKPKIQKAFTLTPKKVKQPPLIIGEIQSEKSSG